MQPHVKASRGHWARLKAEDGQDLAEYALLLFLIALVTVAGMTALGLSIGGLWGGVVQQLMAAL